MKLVKPPERPTVNVLVYGAPKSGKTIGAATAADLGGVLYVNCDLPNATRLAHLRNPDGRIMEPEMPAYNEGKRDLFELMIEIGKEVTKPQDVIQTVVVDPVGELYRRLLEEFSLRSVRPSLPTYGEVSVHVERFCRMLCTAPVNTILVCHELVQQNGEELVSIPYTGTKAGSIDLGQKLQSMVDIIAYTGVIQRDDGSKEYVAQLIPAKGRSGGDRFDVLGDLRALDIAEWIRTIEASEQKSKDVSANVGTMEEPEETQDPPRKKVAA